MRGVLRNLSKLLLLVGILLAAAGPASAASSADVKRPTVQEDASLHVVRSGVLSDATIGAGVQLRAQWRQFDTGSGICSSSAYMYGRGPSGRYIVGGSSTGKGVLNGQILFTSRADDIEYTLYVQAVDCAGNASYVVAHVLKKPLLVQENDPGFAFDAGRWTHRSCACSLAGADLRSAERGARATFTYRGARGVALVSRFAPDGGRAKVYLDGVLVARIDAMRTSARAVDRVVAWEGYSPELGQEHELLIVQTAGQFTVDAVVLTP